MVKLSDLGQQPVDVDRLAAHVRLTVDQTARLLHLTWRNRVDIRDGAVRIDMTPAGPRRYKIHAGGRPVGSGKGYKPPPICSCSMARI